MALILCLETATKACSVCLEHDGKIIALKESAEEKYSHAENLTLYIQEVIKQSGIELKKIDAITVGRGPGSFTGLRIGVSTAKGLCYALEKPLLAINSLATLAAKALHSVEEKTDEKIFIPMIDARRMEVYCAVYDQGLKEIYPASAKVIDSTFIDATIKPCMKDSKASIYFFGDGAEKCRQVINAPNVFFLDDIYISAVFMTAFAENKFSRKEFEGVAYFEPFYLKDFVTTSAIKNHNG